MTKVSNTKLSVVFWSVLVLFLAWDTVVSAPIDLRNEPPLIAAGSGKASVGGHCAIAK
ncbi:hypothetical protein KZZ10_02830 [Alcaligenaceae bacterium LF4-65]|jgi:hypothetical protein|uniref:Uncharacterized protein n=1 Tax=Zwartia hollandica TaxID=324606 RepID=A0A953N7I9_9BURK|nr:hypothetical protein [Zwartia hollandica]MBZ1349569.1 hypothetical protein [Zwartia hollandica]